VGKIGTGNTSQAPVEATSSRWPEGNPYVANTVAPAPLAPRNPSASAVGHTMLPLLGLKSVLELPFFSAYARPSEVFQRGEKSALVVNW